MLFTHFTIFNYITQILWQKQPSSRSAKEAEETEMATTYRDSFENEEDKKKKKERKLGQANAGGMGKRKCKKNCRRNLILRRCEGGGALVIDGHTEEISESK